MKIGDKITGSIERVAKDGSGVILRLEGKPILVYNTIPGETVNATFTKRAKEGIRAKLDDVVEASPDRVVPRCPYAGTCGGCKWQHIDGSRQQALKLNLIRDAFAAAELPCPIDTIVPCPDPFFYRNRMDFVFGRKGELGLKMPDKWWATLDLETCFLLSETSAAIVNDVRAWAKQTGFSFWNGDTHEGFFRYLVIREGKNTGERMVMLVTEAAGGRRQEAGVALAELPEIVGERATAVVWGINPGITDLSIAEEIKPLKGDPWIFEEVNGIRYKITPNAFFQTNTLMAAKLQDTVLSFLPPTSYKLPPTLLDLYCGSGFFSLAIAKQQPNTRVVGIELNAEAIACAKENATMNGVAAEYFVSAAEKFDWTTYKPGVVILDPPRAGMHPDVIATILREKPQAIVYVSCNVDRFVTEFRGTAKHPGLSTAYRIAQATALDLFPHTPHMECVFRLERND